MTLRLAVATEDFGTSLRRAITAAAELPVQGLRLNARTEVRAAEFGETALRQLRHYVEEHQMQVAGLLYSTRHSLTDEKSLDERLDGIRSAMTLVRRLGTAEVLIRVGAIPDPDGREPAAPENLPSNSDVDSLRNPFSFAPAASPLISSQDPSDSRKFETLCQIINDLAAHGLRHGAELQLLVSSYAFAGRLMDAIRSGPVRLVFDPATCVMAAQKPVRVFRDNYQSCGYVRLRDACRDVDGGGVEVRHGDGIVNWDELIPTLMEADYSGWACIERTGGDQRAEDVEHAVRSVRTQLPAQGLR